MSSKAAYLKAMGIEVWSRRSLYAAPVPVSEVSVPAAGQVVAAAGAAIKSDSQPPQAPVVPEKVPEFTLGFIYYETVAVGAMIPAGKEFPRRFCDDLARMMGGKLESPKYQAITWPMLATTGVDQSITAAREVVRRKFELMGSKVMLLGEDVTEYLPQLADVSAWDIGVLDGQHVLVLPTVSELGSTAAKRRLLKLLLAWRR